MQSSTFISSSETAFCKRLLPGIFLAVGMSFLLFGQVVPGVVTISIALMTLAVFWRMQTVELSMGRIRVHRRGEDVWINYADITSIDPSYPVRGYEAAILNLDRETILGQRICFLLERRYFLSPPVLRSRSVHPTISSMRQLCQEAREKSDRGPIC